MRAIRIMANLRVADVDAAKSFYTGYLGLEYRGVQHGMGGALHLSRHRGERPARHARRNRTRRLGHFHPHRPTSKVPMKRRRNSATRS